MPRSKKQVQVKNYQKSDISVFLNTAKKLGIDYATLSKKLHYHPNAYTHWLKAGKMPAIAASYCSVLMNKPETIPTNEQYVLFHMVNGQIKASSSIDVSSAVPIALPTGKFLLIPEPKA